MNFRCPYCNQYATITNPNHFSHWEYFRIEQSEKGQVGLRIYAITCPNGKCKKLYLKIDLTDALKDQTTEWDWKPKKILQTWQLLPESGAKVFPDYIPKPIIEDYYEACRIRDLKSLQDINHFIFGCSFLCKYLTRGNDITDANEWRKTFRKIYGQSSHDI